MFGAYYAGQSYAGKSGTILHYTIVSDDPTHAQTSTTPSLFQLHYLGIEDALHAQAADSNGIVYVINSFVDDTLHGHSVDLTLGLFHMTLEKIIDLDLFLTHTVWHIRLQHVF